MSASLAKKATQERGSLVSRMCSIDQALEGSSGLRCALDPPMHSCLGVTPSLSVVDSL